MCNANNKMLCLVSPLAHIEGKLRDNKIYVKEFNERFLKRWGDLYCERSRAIMLSYSMYVSFFIFLEHKACIDAAEPEGI